MGCSRGLAGKCVCGRGLARSGVWYPGTSREVVCGRGLARNGV